MEALRFGLKLTLELIPLFLGISTLLYVVVEKLTADRIRVMLAGRSRWRGLSLAAGLGALTPFCSCSTVPVVNAMKLAGVPVASLIAFLVASPLISPVAVALLAATVGVEYAVLYAAVGVGFAMLAGVLVARWYGLPLIETAAGPIGARVRGSVPAVQPAAVAHPESLPILRSRDPVLAGAGAGIGSLPILGDGTVAVPPDASPIADSRRLRDAVRPAFLRAVADLRKLWLAIAVAIALGAAIHGYVPTDLLARVAGPDRPWAVPAAALLGLPLYASIVVLLPIGASLLSAGVGVGVVTAFLMGASGFSLPEGIMLAKILPRGLLLRVLAVFSAGVVAIGFGFQALLG